MTATYDADLVPDFTDINTRYTSLKTQVAALTGELETAEADEAAKEAMIESLEALIASLTPTYVGSADPSQADATSVGGNAYRQYNTPGKLPATFTLNFTMPNLKLLVVSHKPDHPTYDQDAAYTTCIKSVVAWCKARGILLIVICEHEPENQDKQPQDSPTNFAAEWRHYRALAVSAGVPIENFECTFMAYTLDDRPGIKGTNPWIDELAKELKANSEPDVGGCSFDTYPHVSAGQSLAANVLPNFAYARAYWPNCFVGIAEWGFSSDDVTTAAHITQGLKDMKTVVRLRYICWFNEGGDNLAKKPLATKALQAGFLPQAA